MDGYSSEAKIQRRVHQGLNKLTWGCWAFVRWCSKRDLNNILRPSLEAGFHPAIKFQREERRERKRTNTGLFWKERTFTHQHQSSFVFQFYCYTWVCWHRRVNMRRRSLPSRGHILLCLSWLVSLLYEDTDNILNTWRGCALLLIILSCGQEAEALKYEAQLCSDLGRWTDVNKIFSHLLSTHQYIFL